MKPSDIDPLKESKIDWGCGLNKCTGFIGVDVKDCKGVDIVCPINDARCFSLGSADVIHSSHFIEHLEYHRASWILEQWYGILKPTGKLIIYFPDMDKLVLQKDHPHFKNWVCGLQRDEYDFHVSWWNIELLAKFLKDCCYKNIKEIEYPQPYHNVERNVSLMSGLECEK